MLCTHPHMSAPIQDCHTLIPTLKSIVVVASIHAGTSVLDGLRLDNPFSKLRDSHCRILSASPTGPTKVRSRDVLSQERVLCRWC